MSAAFTPGPWTYDYAPVSSGDTAEFMILTADRAVVAHVWPDTEKGVTGGTVEANARLIAAAPELLAALSALHEFDALHMKFIKGPDGWIPVSEEQAKVMEHASAAIDKAEGRKP